MKRGDIVWWVVLDARSGEMVLCTKTRDKAREHQEAVGSYYRGFGKDRRREPYARVAKVVLT